MFIRFLVDQYKELFDRSKGTLEEKDAQEKISKLTLEHERLQAEYDKVRAELDRVKQDAYTESVRITNDIHDAY